MLKNCRDRRPRLSAKQNGCIRLSQGRRTRFSSLRRKAEYISALLRSSVSRGSDVPPARHSLPLPFESLYCVPAKTKGHPKVSFCFGWGTGIRTPEMSESESDALPLGDAPIFSTDDIIADCFGFVKGFFEKN